MHVSKLSLFLNHENNVSENHLLFESLVKLYNPLFLKYCIKLDSVSDSVSFWKTGTFPPPNLKTSWCVFFFFKPLIDLYL